MTNNIFFWIFVISLFIIFYSYIGYGILVWIITALKSLWRFFRPKGSGESEEYELPEVTLVVAAYNEEVTIEQKIKNSLLLNYPREKLQFLFVTDGSTDRTAEIVKQYPQIKLLHTPGRSGKTAALNRAMAVVESPITIFSDANTTLSKDAILQIALQYSHPEVGAVSGEKRVGAVAQTDNKAANEGLYWKYESLLKKLDYRLYTVVGAAGELFSIRTALWEPMEDNTILDDFVITVRINLKGYRTAYTPEAYAMETPSGSITEEKKRKVRIVAGAFQAMVLLKPAFNFIKHPVFFFQFFSHRVLRWTLTPLSFVLLFIANFVLLFTAGNPVPFLLIFSLQSLFYLLALIGSLTESGGFKLAKICYYILFMNYTVYLGFIRFLKGKQSVVWEKAKREISSVSL